MTPQQIQGKYDYLDDVPLTGWIWEFVRRNTEYKRLYADLAKALPTTEIYTEYGTYTPSDIYVRVKAKPQSCADLLEDLDEKYGIKPTAIWKPKKSNSYLVREITGSEYFIGIPNPDMNYNELTPEPNIHSSKPVIATTFKEEAIQELLNGNQERFNEYCFKTVNKISPSRNIQNTLYVGISLNAKKDDVRREIEKLLEKMKPLKVKFLPEKWKYYLIVYDLHTGADKMSYDTIGRLLTDAYPTHDGLFDLVNIQNYKKNATVLITSEYQKYMYL